MFDEALRNGLPAFYRILEHFLCNPCIADFQRATHGPNSLNR
jgi:hypothetical protein